MSENKKSNYRTFAEAMAFEKMNIVIPLDHLDLKKISIKEIKDVIREAFKDAKAAAEVEAQEMSHGWGDAEIENQIEWVKALNLKEFIDPSNSLDEKVQPSKKSK